LGEPTISLPPTESKKIMAGILYVTVSAFLLGLKFWAYRLTGSQAVFSDAMESIVNVLAASLSLGMLFISSKPADSDHPYGHGKFEFFSAIFEGGLIAFAAAMILVESVQALVEPTPIRHLDNGIFIIAFTGVANLLLGTYLLLLGKRGHSPSLMASGKHVIADFITTAAVVVGLVVVKFTNLFWLDPVIAIAVAIHLGYTGMRVAWESMGALVDREDKSLLTVLQKTFTDNWFPGIIRIHHTRIMRSGNYHHIDAHVILPEFWDVKTAHAETNKFEKKVIDQYPHEGEIHFHMDPCRRAYCAVCDVAECPVRQEKFSGRKPHTFDELVSPTEPPEFK